jgi:hypothetical protein
VALALDVCETVGADRRWPGVMYGVTPDIGAMSRTHAHRGAKS